MHSLIGLDPEAFDAALARRGYDPMSAVLLRMDEARRAAISRLQESKTEANILAGKIGPLIKDGLREEAAALKARAKLLKDEQPLLKEALFEAEDRLERTLAEIPNLPAADVPDGEDETGNVVIRETGALRIAVGAQHFEIAPGMDFETAAEISGSRFVMLRGDVARLSRALGQFMLDIHTERNGYTEVEPPVLVRSPALFGTGQLPKFEEDLYRIGDEEDLGRLYLIPTAEVPLTNIVRDKILRDEDLPLRFTALTPCFRREAGSAGRDTRGLMRQHQFSKVELVAIVEPEHSEGEHQKMVGDAEDILKLLELPFRTMLLCTGDMGFSAQKTYDLEVYLPGQRAFREISSISNCGAFQARRMDARYNHRSMGTTRHLHTLNGSGLAVGRTLIAVLENYQDGDHCYIPAVLQPYMGGRKTIPLNPV